MRPLSLSRWALAAALLALLSAYGYGYEENAEPRKRFWQRK